MPTIGKGRPAVSFAIDAVIGFGVFAGLTVATLGPSHAACLIGLTASAGSVQPLLAAPASVLEPSGAATKLALLAIAFSALFAFNNAFVRHLRKVYVRSRKGMTKPE